MGAGIAQICARAGYGVKLSDISPEALARGVEHISANLGRQISRGKITEAERAAALAQIETGTDYAIFADCDVVIEAATEKAERMAGIHFSDVVVGITGDHIRSTNNRAVVAVSSAILVIPVNWVMRWALFPDGTSRSLVSIS